MNRLDKKRTIRKRRKRQGKTNYKTRLKLLLSKKPRLVIRKSLKNITAQIVTYEAKGDRVLFSAHSREIVKKGWKASRGNMPAAYLVGLLLAKKAKGIKECIVDLGLNVSKKNSRLYAVVKGAIDGGLKVICNEKVLPDEGKISGKHISDYAKGLKSDKGKYERAFSNYIKNGLDPEKMTEYFNEMKKKLAGAE